GRLAPVLTPEDVDLLDVWDDRPAVVSDRRQVEGEPAVDRRHLALLELLHLEPHRGAGCWPGRFASGRAFQAGDETCEQAFHATLPRVGHRGGVRPEGLPATLGPRR